VSLLVPWLAFPVLLAVLSLGLGLLVEAIAGSRLHGALLLPVGFAGIVVVADTTTLSASTARHVTPLVVALAVAGFALAAWGDRLRTLRPDAWAVGAVVAVFAVYAAPVVMLGRATFAGYSSLDDTAQWFSLIDRVMSYGRSAAGLPPSTYHHILHEYLHTGYPVGSMIPLGVGARLVGRDVAWVLQPYFAFAAVLLGLSLWVMLAGPIRSRRWRAPAVFIASQPALLYGYALWGSIKEVVTAALLPLLAILVARALRSTPSVRDLVPLAVVSAAVLAALNLAALVWLVPALLPLVVVARRIPAQAFARRTAGFVACIAVLALPTLAVARTFTAAANHNLAAGAHGLNELGELKHPLSVLQLLGIWPVGDFRNSPRTFWPTGLLLALLLLLAVGGLVVAVRRRAWSLPLYVTMAVVGWLALRVGGTPWTIGKELATASPALLAAAFGGIGLLAARRGRPALVAGAAAVALAGGVLWSNALAYSGARLAPNDQLAELDLIGHEFAGQGPTLMTEFQPYGVRHFLRELAVSQLPPKNIDAFPLAEVESFRTLVLDHSPLESRPPANYRLARAGRFYDVWQRIPGVPRPLQQIALGQGIQPAGTLACSRIVSVARVATQRHERLATVLRPAALGFELGAAQHPAAWTIDPSGGVYPTSAGTVVSSVAVPAAGRYGVWVGGYTPGRLTVTVDGDTVGSVVHRIELPGQYYPVGWIQLTRGRHRIVLGYSRPLLQPGSTSGTAQLPMGPLVVSRDTEDLPVTYVRPVRAHTLCGRSLDWLEVVR